MKAILISDHAKWCFLMMNGKKKIEVRKGTALYKATQKLIDEYGYAEFYVYCTKGKPNLWLPYEYDCFELDEASQPYLSDKPIVDIDTKMNGKVIFKFRCYKVEETHKYVGDILKDSCLTIDEFCDYLGNKIYAYAIHISDLEIFDRPKELSEFNKYGCEQYDKDVCAVYGERGHLYTNCFFHLTKAPQSFMFIESEK